MGCPTPYLRIRARLPSPARWSRWIAAYSSDLGFDAIGGPQRYGALSCSHRKPPTVAGTRQHRSSRTSGVVRAERQPLLELAHTLKPMQGFAGFLRQDLDAVTAGLTLPWSSGVVEGHVNRIETIKRAMYGRAGFRLLRTRILARA
ncbi:transposase [Streptomyces sp. 900105755]